MYSVKKFWSNGYGIVAQGVMVDEEHLRRSIGQVTRARDEPPKERHDVDVVVVSRVGSRLLRGYLERRRSRTRSGFGFGFGLRNDSVFSRSRMRA
jgi:hypothetical protein